jgi:aspartate/glutamate racemase
MNELNKNTIGIVGGAGPMASCLLNQYIVEICQKKFGCKDDRDFPFIINYSFPFSPMLQSADARDYEDRISQELSCCLADLSRGRRLVHRNCLQYATQLSA